jgi:hypothetical protein
MVRRERPGRTTLGCLVTLLLLSAAGYFGYNVGRVYWRWYQFQDAMAQQARFAAHTDDATIRSHLAAKADSLDLPPAAHRVHIRRAEHTIFIWSDYIETVEMPGFVKDIDFTAHVARAF